MLLILADELLKTDSSIYSMYPYFFYFIFFCGEGTVNEGLVSVFIEGD